MPPILGHGFALAQDFTALTYDHRSFLLKVQLKCNVFLLVDKIRNQIYVSYFWFNDGARIFLAFICNSIISSSTYMNEQPVSIQPVYLSHLQPYLHMAVTLAVYHGQMITD